MFHFDTPNLSGDSGEREPRAGRRGYFLTWIFAGSVLAAGYYYCVIAETSEYRQKSIAMGPSNATRFKWAIFE
jgi:hypothetical protein